MGTGRINRMDLMTLTMYRYTWKKAAALVAVMALTVLLAGCAGTRKGTKEAVEEPGLQVVKISVAKENLRDAPQGEKIGEAVKGQSFRLVQRRGNWCEVSSEGVPDAWIWSASLGYSKINPLDLSLWLGLKGNGQDVDGLTALFGAPVEVKTVNPQLVIYEYPNADELFGTGQFESVQAWVDRATRAVVRVQFDLPPYVGKRMGLLAEMGLPKLKASKTDFDHSLYLDKFEAAGSVEMIFVEGSFDKIRTVVADRYNGELSDRFIDIREKKVTIEDDYLTLELTMKNTSTSVAFSSPSVELELVENGRNLGTWVLGPGNVRLDPGQEKTFRMPIPLKAATVNVKQVGARSELTDMFVVPPTGGTSL